VSVDSQIMYLPLCLERGRHTSQLHVVVVIHLVDSLHLSPNIKFLCNVEQVLNRRMLLVSTKDLLGFLLPICDTVSKVESSVGLLENIGLTCLACTHPRWKVWLNYGHL
jgi:hypothetical protein